MSDKKLLLHTCCAPCGAYSAKFLQEAGYNVTYYFYNPNIFPQEEYQRRLEELKRFAHDVNIPLIIENSNYDEWLEYVAGYENEPERGKRCYLCYKIRLEKTAQKAKALKFDYFTTTLSISPHKSYDMICEISNELAPEYGISYLDVNLKKKDGYKKSVELSKQYGFYRQDYCGCEFSKISRSPVSD